MTADLTTLVVLDHYFTIRTPFIDPEALDPCFFDPGYTLAAQTGKHILVLVYCDFSIFNLIPLSQ